MICSRIAIVVQLLGRMLPKPLTRVRIPAIALIFHFLFYCKPSFAGLVFTHNSTYNN